MMQRLIALILLSIGLAGCGENLGTYHFRLTVEVETTDGIRSGSSVLAATYSRGPNMQGSESAHAELRGEAVFVDLGSGRNLIALLTHGPRGDDDNSIMWLPVTALTGAPWGWGSTDALKARGKQLLGEMDLKPPLIPTMASFGDLNDPASARVIEPSTAGFTSVFGPGYRLQRVRLEMVPAGVWPLNLIGLWGTPVTKRIEDVVPFLTSHRAQLRSVIRNMPPRFQTNSLQFIRE